MSAEIRNTAPQHINIRLLVKEFTKRNNHQPLGFYVFLMLSIGHTKFAWIKTKIIDRHDCKDRLQSSSMTTLVDAAGRHRTINSGIIIL